MRLQYVLFCLLVLLLPLIVFAAPTITLIDTTTSNGAYKSGEVIPIKVDFNENIIINGTPVLMVNAGGNITYNSSTQNSISFTYTVSNGANTTNLDAIGLTIDGNIVAENDSSVLADLTMPTGRNNLNTGIIIDTVAPATDWDFNANSNGKQIIRLTCSDSTSGCNTTSYRIDSDSSNSITLGDWVNRTQIDTTSYSDGNYVIDFNSNDLARNTETTKRRIIIIDTSGPTSGNITNTYRTNYTNNNKTTLTLSATDNLSGMSGGQMAFSCDSEGSLPSEWHITAYATSYSNFDITDDTYNCSSSDGNKLIYVKYMDKAGNWGNTTYTTNILYDHTAPSAPTSLNASSGNAKITLTWNTPEVDNLSGNDKIIIYMKKGSGSYDLNKNLTDENATSQDITALTNGTEYCFKLKTVDRAGNESNYSEEVCATPASSTATLALKINGKAISGALNYAKKGDVIGATCSYSASISEAKIKIKAYNPASSEQDLKTSSSSTTSISEDYTIPNNAEYEKIGFWCTATGINNSSTQYVYLDSEAPTISWTDSNNSFTGIRNIQVTVSDNKSIDKVEFDLNGTIINLTKKSNTIYQTDFNSIKYNNGTFNLKANAYDLAGNKTTISRTITIENITTVKQRAEILIMTAKAKQKTANDAINSLQKNGLVVPVSLSNKKTQADNELASAENKLNSDANTALINATNAGALYEEFNQGIKNTVTQMSNYAYDSNSLTGTLTHFGFTQEKEAQLIQIIKDSNIQRQLKLVKLSGENDKTQIVIELRFKNDTNETEIKIVEIIPKELVDSATKIVSDTNFIILQNDPIIQFNVSVPKGSTKTISYGIGEIQNNVAQQIIDNNTLTKFSAPPLLLSINDKPEEIFKDNTNITQLLLLIAGIIIVILIIIAILFFVKFANPGHGFGGNKNAIEHLTGEKKEEDKQRWSAP